MRPHVCTLSLASPASTRSRMRWHRRAPAAAPTVVPWAVLMAVALAVAADPFEEPERIVNNHLALEQAWKM